MRRDGITDIWGPCTPHHGQHASPVRVDENASEAPGRRDLWLPTNEGHVSIIASSQAPLALRDEDPIGILERVERGDERQRQRPMTRIKQAAPRTSVVPS